MNRTRLASTPELTSGRVIQIVFALVVACAILAEAIPAPKVDSGEVMYVGGTIPNLPEGTMGQLDTKNEKVLMFHSSKGNVKETLRFLTRTSPPWSMAKRQGGDWESRSRSQFGRCYRRRESTF